MYTQFGVVLVAVMNSPWMHIYGTHSASTGHLMLQTEIVFPS